MFGFIKKVFFTGLVILSSLTSATSLRVISMTNKECNDMINRKDFKSD